MDELVSTIHHVVVVIRWLGAFSLYMSVLLYF